MLESAEHAMKVVGSIRMTNAERVVTMMIVGGSRELTAVRAGQSPTL